MRYATMTESSNVASRIPDERNMRLSLATLLLLPIAAAAQVERDPADVIAVVLGQEITVADVSESPIDGLINGLLMSKFAEDNAIEATEEELAAYLDRMAEMGRQSLAESKANRAELAAALDQAVDTEERRQIQEDLDALELDIEIMSQTPQAGLDILRPVAKRWVERWKLDKALFEKYGGRAHFQQVGVQPFDAVIRFLEEQEASGAFTILDEDYEAEFWAYWRSDGHSFIPEEEAAQLLATPWWLMDKPPDE